MDISQLVKKELTGIDPNVEVLLFGSRARGDFRDDSDWDFLILFDIPLTQELKDTVLTRLYYLEIETDTVISAILHTRTEWEDRAVTPLYQIIQKEGKRA